MPDDYHSARQPSEFEYDTEETDPKEPEDDPKEDDASVVSDSTYKSSGHDTDQTCRTNILNRNHRRNQRKRKEHRDRLMLRGKKIGVKARWSCPCSGTPQRRAP